MLQYVLPAVNTVMFLIIIIVVIKPLKVFTHFIRVTRGIMIDKEVDVWFEKAVVIAYLLHRDEKKTPQEKYTLIIERTCNIVADVMLQHGQNPKDYNLQGLAAQSLYKTGLMTIIENEKAESNTVLKKT